MKRFNVWSAKVALLAAFFVATPVMAQWQTPDHSVPIGRGSGTGFKSASPGTSGQVLTSNGSSSDPSFQSVSGLLPNGSANQIPVYTGSTNAVTATSASTWFDNAYCSTVGRVIARFTGSWTCAAGIPANAAWWGVVADGTTDNTTSLGNAIAAVCGAGGGYLVLPTGSGMIEVNGGFTINHACRIEGAGGGGGLSGAEIGGSIIHQNSLTADTFYFTTDNAVTLQFLGIRYGTGANGTGSAIHIRVSASVVANVNRGTVINGVRVFGGGYGIYCDRCHNFAFTNNTFIDFGTTGIYLSQDSTVVDAGDAIVSGNLVWAFTRTTANSCIRLDPMAAVQVIGNKTLGCQVSVYLTASQGPTGTLLVGNNSFEEFTVNAVRVEQTTAGKAYGFVNVHNNQMQSSSTTTQGAVVVVAGLSSQYVVEALFHDNIISIFGSTYGSPACFSVNDGNYVIVHHNICNLNSVAGGIGYATGGRATNITLRDNIVYGNLGVRYSLGVTTNVFDMITSLAFASLPSAADGSQMYCSDCHATNWAGANMTATGSGYGGPVFRQGGAWISYQP